TRPPASSAATATATGALLVGFADDEGPAFQVVPVPRRDGRARSFRRSHADEGEATGPAGFPIRHHAGLAHLTMGGEKLGQLGVGGAPRQVAYIDLGRHAEVSERVKNIALPGTSPPAARAVRLERPENATRPERLPSGTRMAAALEFLAMGVDETVRGSREWSALPCAGGIRLDATDQD